MTLDYLNAHDGHRIALHQWHSTVEPRGLVLWLHGMAEHGARYAPLAAALNASGWHLYAPDHRGHGASVADNELRGHFADQDGWDAVVSDVSLLINQLRKQHPGLPLVLGGHSMGSFIALSVAERLGSQLDGLILCGSDYKSPWLWKLALLPVSLARWKNGPRGTSALIAALTFDAFAKKIPHRRTAFDWLSRDPVEVDKYIADPWCGHDCTTQLWHDLISALASIDAPATLRKMPPSLPVMLVGGDNDPMSGNGKGMPALYKALHKAGLADLTFGLFVDGRHEILNDLCRDEVLEEIKIWLAR
ncbi:MAG: alpha/beta fold hydrolase [Alcanivoracaceae bacterium]